jgi:hypothetical protein
MAILEPFDPNKVLKSISDPFRDAYKQSQPVKLNVQPVGSGQTLAPTESVYDPKSPALPNAVYTPPQTTGGTGGAGGHSRLGTGGNGGTSGAGANGKVIVITYF